MKFEITPCVPADLPELFDRFSSWYRYNPRMAERDYFDWQFRDAPNRRSDGDYDFLVLREGGRITGCLGYVGFELRQGESVQPAGWPSTWYSQSRCGGGLRLYARYMELFENRLITRFSDITQELYDYYRVPYIRAIPRWWAALDSARAGAICGLQDPHDADILRRSETALKRVEPRLIFRLVDRHDDAAEFRFTHLAGIDSGCRRSGRYLNWRYRDIPKHNYHMFRSESGMAVYRTEQILHQEPSVVRIVEWTFGADETERALATLLADTAALDPVLIDFHTTARSVGRTLEPFGFVPQTATTRPMPDLFRPLHHSGGYQAAIDLPPHRTARTVDFDRWYITTGDADVERVKL